MIKNRLDKLLIYHHWHFKPNAYYSSASIKCRKILETIWCVVPDFFFQTKPAAIQWTPAAYCGSTFAVWERLGSAPTTITCAGEEPCWPCYATVLYDLWLCLCASAALINIRAHTHNLNYTVLNTYYIIPSVSWTKLLRIILVWRAMIFCDGLLSSWYSTHHKAVITLFKVRWPSVGS